MSLRGTCAVDLTFPSNALTYKNKTLHCVYFTKNPQRATLNQQARVPSVHRMNNLGKKRCERSCESSELQAGEALGLRMGLESEAGPLLRETWG